MEIHIVHLYYDLLNLYGESGNVKALKYQLEQQGLTPVIHFKTIDDEINFKDYDVIYMGAGTEDNLELVREDILKYQKQIKKEIEKNKIFLITGNALNLFGTSIKKDKKKNPALSIFDFSALEENRKMDECYMEFDFLKNGIIGFQNQCTIIKNNKYPMFDVKRGIGTKEGVHYKNFYGTYVIGPILVRNPELLIYFTKEIMKSKKIKDFKEPDLTLEQIAHDNYVKRYYGDFIKERG
jgi:CobQ-like glutamine amidotransferase family enzyme